MGVLRLYLAICVVAGHSDPVVPWDLHQGREAVQIFFIISGFYMQLILQGGKYPKPSDFYRSRALRIYFPYFVILAFVVGVSAIYGMTRGDWLTLSETAGPSGNGTFGRIATTVTNFTVFFQDWTLFSEHDAGEPFRFTTEFRTSAAPLWRVLWIPQAWSVGVELAFYLFAPFIVRGLGPRGLLALAGLSLAGRFICYEKFGLLHDPWTYRFFPFEIAHFCYGILGCRLMTAFPDVFGRIGERFRRLRPKLGKASYPLAVIALLAALWAHSEFFRGLQAEVSRDSRVGGEIVYLVSLSLWILILPCLFTVSRDLDLDRRIGELSYPVYLLHFTLAAGFAIWPCGGGLRPLTGEITAATTILVAILMQRWIFGPFERWRQLVVRQAQVS